MTNAPYMLNLDCDMFVNNPEVVLQAMCLLLDPKIDKEFAFVQFPQCFYNGLKDDPAGNQAIVVMQVIYYYYYYSLKKKLLKINNYLLVSILS